MTSVILVIHIMITVALISIVLLQKSEGGALGMGGGGMSGFMTGRSTANLLTRMTALLVAAFFITSITLAYIASSTRQPSSVIDQAPPATSQPAQPQPATPAAPATPAEPSAPLAK